MSDLDAKREEIAAAIAQGLGLGGLASLGADERAEVDRRTAEALATGASGVPDDPPTEAGTRLRWLLAEYRDLEALRADTANARLAEEGEVFAPEDDA